jgi:hypothetical protein
MFRNQVTKFFISLSYETMSANYENLTKKDMRITNEFTLNQNSNGQYNSLVFKNLSFTSLEESRLLLGAGVAGLTSKKLETSRC